MTLKVVRNWRREVTEEREKSGQHGRVLTREIYLMLNLDVFYRFDVNQ